MSSEPLTSFENALAILRKIGRARKLVAETIPLEQGLGRVLAADLRSPENHPAWNCSAMDGFAVSFADAKILDASFERPVLGQIAAGDAPLVTAERGVWEIMTGAPMPPGCDSVVRIEDTEVFRGADGQALRVRLKVTALEGRNVRERGEDFAEGREFLRAGHVLRAEDLLCLATLGLLQISVRARLRVGLIATGRELVELSTDELGPGQIRNSSALYLRSALSARGVETVNLGIVSDDAAHFKKIVTSPEAAALDLLISTGAVSMGQFDFVGPSLEELGAKILFRKVRVKPAKPILFAEIPRANNSLLYLGLPGNPVSTAVGLRFFFDPLLASLSAAKEESPLFLPLAHETRKTPGVVSYLRGTVVTIDGESRVRLHEQQQASMMSPLLGSDCWVQLPEGGDLCASGERVAVYRY